MAPLTQSYYSGASSTQIIYQTIGDYLDSICERFPDNEALVVRHQNVRWTYTELKREIDRLWHYRGERPISMLFSTAMKWFGGMHVHSFLLPFNFSEAMSMVSSLDASCTILQIPSSH